MYFITYLINPRSFQPHQKGVRWPAHCHVFCWSLYT